MKKKFSFMLLLAVVVVGCNNTNSKIEMSFNEYVEESFGDPDDFVKITKIQENPDTIKVSAVMPLVEASSKLAKGLMEEAENVKSSFEEMEIGLKTNADYISLMGNDSKVEKFKKLLIDGKALLNESISLAGTIINEAQNIQNKYRDEAPLYLQYAVSVRQKNSDGKKEITTYYARCPYGKDEFKIFTNSAVSNIEELNFQGYSQDPMAKNLGKELTELISNVLKLRKFDENFNDLNKKFSNLSEDTL